MCCTEGDREMGSEMQAAAPTPVATALPGPRYRVVAEEAGRGVVDITAFRHGWCSSGNITFERAKRAAAEFGDKVRWREIGTLDRETYLEWGISEGIFVDGKNIRTGPPLSYDKIRRKIAKRVKKLPSQKGMREVQG